MHNFKRQIQNVDKFSIYCAGEFASLVVQYCIENGFGDKIANCIVTKRDRSVPAYILGIPVVELNSWEQERESLVVVAILSEHGRNEISDLLKREGYSNIYFLSEDEFRKINYSLIDFSAEIKCELRRLVVQNQRQSEQIQQLYEKMSMLIQSMPVVAETHKRTFGKYKDINKGKSVVICAPGPSLNQYQFHDDYIHIGVNAVIFKDKIKLDYYFSQHIPSEFDFWGNGSDVEPASRKKYMEYFSKQECIQFLGQRIGKDWNISPPYGEYSGSAYNVYYTSDLEETHQFFPDIRYNFLYGATSIIFPALQFALFTNPRRIFIVGSDGYDVSGKNYYLNQIEHEMEERITDISKEMFLPYVNKNMEEIYKELRKFAVIRYPNTEIIMVNPVHFKGIFKETITDENGQIVLD